MQKVFRNYYKSVLSLACMTVKFYSTPRIHKHQQHKHPRKMKLPENGQRPRGEISGEEPKTVNDVKTTFAEQRNRAMRGQY